MSGLEIVLHASSMFPYDRADTGMRRSTLRVAKTARRAVLVPRKYSQYDTCVDFASSMENSHEPWCPKLENCVPPPPWCPTHDSEA